MYHRVVDEVSDPHRICISPTTFRRHQEYLGDTCTVLSVAALVDGALAGELPSRAAAVTLDDGYLDNLEEASPILTELGIPATFFVCTEKLDEGHEPWWDVADRVLTGGWAMPATLRVKIDRHALELPTGTWDERQRALMSLHALLSKPTLRLAPRWSSNSVSGVDQTVPQMERVA